MRRLLLVVATVIVCALASWTPGAAQPALAGDDSALESPGLCPTVCPIVCPGDWICSFGNCVCE